MQCPCCLSKTRRQLLGIMAATAGGLLVTRLSPASAAPIKRGADVPVRSVDIHAHYYPEEFLHLLGSEGKAFGASYTRQETTFSFATPAGGSRLSNYYLSNLLGNPFDTAIAASHLILGGVLDQYPQLHVSLPLAGGALPILVGRLDAGWTSRPETRRLAQKPSSYLTRFSYDTVSHSGPVLDYLIANVGIDHLVLGSDYCFDMGYEQPVRFVESVGLGPREKAAVLGANAARILGLPA
jgi:hypothetical protein